MKGKWVAWLALLGAAALCCAPAWAGTAEGAGEDSRGQKVWQGRLADGRVIGREELAEILRLHQVWVDTDGRDGQWAYLRGADFTEAPLMGVDLSSVDLSGANLSGANLYGATLQKTHLENANLRKAILQHTDLSMAKLNHADLSQAQLVNTKVAKAEFSGVTWSGAIFEPNFHVTGQVNSNDTQELGHWPLLTNFADPIDLHLISFNDPHPITALRDKLNKSCFHFPSRQLTHALRHNQGSVGLGSHIAYYLIACPTNWGLSPLRPIGYLFLLIFPFSLIYWLALYRADPEGIWMIWDPNSLRRPPHQPWKQLLKIKDGANPLFTLYFSLLSAFHIGWRQFNVGNWLSRMQPREYTLRASGWARLASGLQSLISVYLLALAVLTYFGRPFE